MAQLNTQEWTWKGEQECFVKKERGKSGLLERPSGAKRRGAVRTCWLMEKGSVLRGRELLKKGGSRTAQKDRAGHLSG